MTHKLYNELSWLWPFWEAPEDYADYCNHVVYLISEHSQIPVRTILNIGSGGGKNVFNLKSQFEVTGIDLSPNMNALAKELNPNCEFLEGDMRDFSLNRTFDAILMDDGISHLTSRSDLTSAFEIAYQHLRPGGVMVVGPDNTTETFIQNRTVIHTLDQQNKTRQPRCRLH
jgi:SAM-dependent methyltransferase